MSTATAPLASRIGAFALDVGAGMVAIAAAGLIAFLWLLVRTEWGAYTPGAGDSAVALALLLAAPAGWLAWVAASVIIDGASPGHRRAALRVRPSPPSRTRLVKWLALHPLGSLAWLWLALVAALAALPVLLTLLAAAAVILGAGGIASALLVATGRSALHDRLAGVGVHWDAR